MERERERERERAREREREREGERERWLWSPGGELPPVAAKHVPRFMHSAAYWCPVWHSSLASTS